MISAKLLKITLESWNENCKNIMPSQKKHNDEALAWSRARLEEWLKELNDVHSI